MDYLYIGKIVNTHGIKGELRIRSTFDYIEKAFKPGITFYIGEHKTPEKVLTYRHHKEYEMVTFANYTNINEVLKYLTKDVYIKKDDLDLTDNEYCLEEIIGFDVYEKEQKIGKIANIVYNGSNILLSIQSTKNFYIPNNPYFIKKVDLEAKRVIAENTEGLIL